MDIKDENLLRDTLEAYLFERLEQISAEYRATEEYQKLLGAEKKLYDELKELLPCDSRPLFIRYTDTLYNIMTELQHYFYRCGLKDSVRLMKYFLDGGR